MDFQNEKLPNRTLVLVVASCTLTDTGYDSKLFKPCPSIDNLIISNQSSKKDSVNSKLC